MQTILTAKPVHEVIAAIQALDLEIVKQRLMDPKLGEGWTREYADSIEAAYKNFLTVAVKNQDDVENILPSKDVDELWHTHILHTIKYADDCDAMFGAYLHHNPHTVKFTPEVLEKRDSLAENTRQLYEREFGSAKRAAAAWAGNTIRAGNAAVSNIAIRSNDAAVSNIAIRADNAAVSNIAIRADNAAVSNIAIRADNAAVSNIAIRAGNAAVSNIAIRADNAAVSNIAIRAGNAAVSNIAIRADNAAVSNIAIRADNAAVSNIAIRADNAAVSNIVIRPKQLVAVALQA